MRFFDPEQTFLQPPHRLFRDRKTRSIFLFLSLSLACSLSLSLSPLQFILSYLLHETTELGQRGPALLLVTLPAAPAPPVAAAVTALAAAAAAFTPSPSSEAALEAAAVTHLGFAVVSCRLMSVV